MACPKRLLDVLPKVWEIKHDAAEARKNTERVKQKAMGGQPG